MKFGYKGVDLVKNDYLLGVNTNRYMTIWGKNLVIVCSR